MGATISAEVLSSYGLKPPEFGVIVAARLAEPDADAFIDAGGQPEGKGRRASLQPESADLRRAVDVAVRGRYCDQLFRIYLTCIVFPAILLFMGKQDKIVTAMRSNPRDWRIEQIESVAAHAGLKGRKNGGSHVVIQRDGCPLEVCVPARKPIKAVYVVQLLALIDWSPE